QVAPALLSSLVWKPPQFAQLYAPCAPRPRAPVSGNIAAPCQYQKLTPRPGSAPQPAGRGSSGGNSTPHPAKPPITESLLTKIFRAPKGDRALSFVCSDLPTFRASTRCNSQSSIFNRESASAASAYTQQSRR